MTLGYDVHVIASNEIRIKYTIKVTDSALNINNYTITSIAPTGTAVTPSLISVLWYDSTQNSVVITTNINLTTYSDYSMTVSNIITADGSVISGVTKNFTANVLNSAKPIGAWQSKRGFIDILFDRPVGSYSSGASFYIRDASSFLQGVIMAQSTWATENITEYTLRVSLPSGTPKANGFVIDFSGVQDSSMNPSLGTVAITLFSLLPPPYSLYELLQLQIIDAYVLAVDSEYLKFGIVRVFFNGPADVDVVKNTQFLMYQSGPHVKSDVANEITASRNVIPLANDIKAKFNAHIIQNGVHVVNDPENTILSPDAVDNIEAITILNEAEIKFLNHYRNTISHKYPDFNNEFVNVVIDQSNIALANDVATLSLKATYNIHIQSEQEVSFLSPQSGVMDDISRHSMSSDCYSVNSPFSYFIDLHVSLSSVFSTVRIAADVPSEDKLSFTSSKNPTGNFIARSYSNSTSYLSHIVTPDKKISVLFSGDLSLQSSNSISVSDYSGNEMLLGLKSLSASLQNIAMTVNFLIVAFNHHISSLSASHENPDIIDFIMSGITAPDIAVMIVKANELKYKLNNHVGNITGIYHIHADSRKVTTTDAVDLRSLSSVVASIRDVYISHNESGPHSRPGIVVYNARYFDTIDIFIPGMMDSSFYSLNGKVNNSYLSLPGNGEIGKEYNFQNSTVLRFTGDIATSILDIAVPFIGIATIPSLASAVPRSGIEISDDLKLHFESDKIEVYFSKEMSMTPLDFSNIKITGGSIIQKSANWISNRVASIQVVNMEKIAYSITATGLKDEAGNMVQSWFHFME